MSRLKKTVLHCSIALLAGLGTFSCDEDINQQGSPVLLVANVTEAMSQIDFTDATCSPAVVYSIRAIPKRTTVPGGGTGEVDVRFLDVIIRTMRTSFVRVDGGTVVPPPLVENLSFLVPATGEASEIPTRLIFPVEYLREAPFVALTAAAGGRDPETGQPFVRMDLVVEFFGETLAGDPVYTSLRWPATFCFNCGGCAPEDEAGG